MMEGIVFVYCPLKMYLEWGCIRGHCCFDEHFSIFDKESFNGFTLRRYCKN
jgi:hypothetical protein